MTSLGSVMTAFFFGAFVIASAAASFADPASSGTPQASASPPDPYEIYAASIKAMRVAQAVGKPAYSAYQLSMNTHNLEIFGERNAKTSNRSDLNIKLVHANHHYDYQAWYRTRGDRGLSQDLTTHEMFNEAFFNPEPVSMDEDSSGASPTPSVASPTPSPESQLGAPPSLGKLSIFGNRYYRITLVGLETVEGGPAYHLHLVAKGSDKDHPLTDLWVDPSTYLMRKAHAVYTFRAVAMGGGGQGDLTFGKVGKYWMATGFDFNVTMYALLWHANIGMDVHAHDIVLPASLPDAYFPGTPAPSSSPAR